jgi:hypothetical protein
MKAATTASAAAANAICLRSILRRNGVASA